ncbi:MAG TPA: hypothetical protein VNY05_39745, partial [Candidatus Acidoferrales bacterium]|nr:hypothetical protein [Candidatus Acidoferrales bacterium]
MSTQAQIDANRRNSQESTGPRSFEGKAASAMNAFKTGINAKREILRGEKPEELQALSDLYYQRWAPTTPEQAYLVDILISTDWITRRLRRVEAELWEHHIADAWKPNKKCPIGQAFQMATGTFDSLTRRIESTVRMNRKALEALIKMEALIKLKPAAAAPARPPDPEPVAVGPPPVLPPEPQQNQSTAPKIGFVLPIPAALRAQPAQPATGHRPPATAQPAPSHRSPATSPSPRPPLPV